ncbi:hypothetical protein KQJ29_36240, partial [Enterococcus sp. S181_ASV_20]|nr:hypothetical protein [Enterococcus sp. S181_ASV_20]
QLRRQRQMCIRDRPTTTPQQKVSQVRFFGGEFADIHLVGDTFDASAAAAKKYCEENGMTFICLLYTS